MVDQIFLFPQVTGGVIITNKLVYTLVASRVAINQEISGISQNLIKLLPSAFSPPPKMKVLSVQVRSS